jgi:hypothetical protein
MIADTLTAAAICWGFIGSLGAFAFYLSRWGNK